MPKYVAKQSASGAVAREVPASSGGMNVRAAGSGVSPNRQRPTVKKISNSFASPDFNRTKSGR